MTNPIIIETIDFTLSIYTNVKTLENRQVSYKTVLAKRSQILPEQYVVTLQIFLENQELVKEKLLLAQPFFFENMKYQFEWAFKCNPTSVTACHHLTQINESFRFSSRKQLFGELNSANDIGLFSLPVMYQKGRKLYKALLSFEILPSKIDLHRDLPAIYSAVDQEFPLFRFNFLGKTEQHTGLAKQRGNFPLFWLAHFKQLRLDLERALQLIIRAPHHRLQPHIYYERAEKLKGKLSAKRIAQVRQHIKQGERQHRYVVQKQVLSFDTPENRFIKNVIVHCQKQLQQLLKIVQVDRFSDVLRTELYQWYKTLNKLEKQSFLRDLVPNRNEKASLVLQQKTGYSQIYQIWQSLKVYLDFFGNSREISMKSIAELYEIWCFIEIKNILLSLGFQLIESKKEKLALKTYEMQLNNGFAGAFVLEKGDIRLRLAHEPVFGKKSYQHIKSYWNSHKPDILLQAETVDGRKYIWLFDAKYRLHSFNSKRSYVEEQMHDDYYAKTQDYAPEDAINQMYRYHDALIYEHKNSLSPHSRPVFGAFALYPGLYDQLNESNPYQEAIEEVGVGAFALLPSEDNSGNSWLRLFINEKLTAIQTDTSYLQKAQRIPSLGMRQHYYSDLLMTIRIGDQRTIDYITNFQQGSAKYYHTKAEFIQKHYRHFAMEELRYLAIAYPRSQNSWEISHIYPITQLELKPRNQLLPSETGAEKSESRELYYLFSLGKSIPLAQIMRDIPTDSFRKTVKFSTLVHFLQSNNFMQLASVYLDMLHTIGNEEEIIYESTRHQ